MPRLKGRIKSVGGDDLCQIVGLAFEKVSGLPHAHQPAIQDAVQMANELGAVAVGPSILIVLV